MDVRPSDERAMDEALRLAGATGRMGNVPVGAVILVDDTIVARAANLRETLQDPTAHAEMLVLREAAAKMGSWRLEDATMVVTLEPCAMCAATIAQARIKRLVYGADEPKTGAVHHGPRLLTDHPIVVERGLKERESRALLEDFFKKLRGRE